MAMLNCRFFNGYRPCHKNESCSPKCPHMEPLQTNILMVHLGALGAVLRSTCLLRGIRQKYPHSHITWVTQSPAHHLLQNNPLIDRVCTNSAQNILHLSAFHYHIGFCIDKSPEAFSIIKNLSPQKLFGFYIPKGYRGIAPATPAAEELWQIGLSNTKKFFENQKTENQLLYEALELGPYKGQPYEIFLTKEEEALSQKRHQLWSEGKQKICIGINTGCSSTIPYKKLSISSQRKLIQSLLNKWHNIQVILLGGKEDEKRNKEIAKNLPVILSPTNQGLRDGLCSVKACDLVISGDSLGMHMAIALKKWVVAWFGPTCPQEIDFYHRGVKVQTRKSCAPCWKRHCSQQIKCNEDIDILEILQGVSLGLKKISGSINISSNLSL
ncbi:MAG: glycosyltransferase family 9 protein [Bdellovibrio sp.]|nr:MAG: glycosyltransferase family 9 protein [Bdellovibrio sp.]